MLDTDTESAQSLKTKSDISFIMVICPVQPDWHFFHFHLSQHVIYFVKFIISYIIPDVSQKTKSKVKREKYLTQKLLHENDLKGVKKNMGKIAEKIIKGADSTFRPKDE